MRFTESVICFLFLVIFADSSFSGEANRSFSNVALVQKQIRQVADVASVTCVSLRTKTGGWGSGMIVSEDGFLFTAAHAVGGIGSVVAVWDAEGEKFNARVLSTDRSLDVALVKIQGQRKWVFPRIDTQTGSGELMVAAGFAGGFQKERGAPVRLGMCLYKRDGAKRIVSSCRISAGDSGGGIFDLDGNLVGINIAIGQKGEKAYHIGIETVLRTFSHSLPEQMVSALSFQDKENS